MLDKVKLTENITNEKKRIFKATKPSVIKSISIRNKNTFDIKFNLNLLRDINQLEIFIDQIVEKDNTTILLNMVDLYLEKGEKLIAFTKDKHQKVSCSVRYEQNPIIDDLTIINTTSI